MRSCGSVPGRREVKLSYEDGNGDGWPHSKETFHQHHLPVPWRAASAKGLGGKAYRGRPEGGLYRRSMRTWGWHGIKWNGLHKTVSGGKLQRRPYASVKVKWTKHLLGVKSISSNVHKAGSWYLLEALFKISHEHPRSFYMGVTPGDILPIGI